MPVPYKSSFRDLLLAMITLLVGGLFLALHQFDARYGTTPANELTLVKGVAAHIEESVGEGTRFLKFSVGGFRTEYSSDWSNYEGVLAGVRSRRPIEAWVSTKREKIVSRQGWVPLYRLSVAGVAVLKYEDVVARHSKTLRSMLIGGWFVVGLGILCLLLHIRNRRRYAAWVTGPREAIDPALELQKRLRRTAAIFSVILYGIIIGLNFDAKVRAKQIEAFGTRPLGIPVTLVVVIIQTMLFIPIPVFSRHLGRLISQAGADGSHPGVVYLLVAGIRHPELRRSQLICIFGFAYFIMVGTFWMI